jgi:hypothetical protein
MAAWLARAQHSSAAPVTPRRMDFRVVVGKLRMG